jgi:hypothetical protein
MLGSKLGKFGNFFVAILKTFPVTLVIVDRGRRRLMGKRALSFG